MLMAEQEINVPADDAKKAWKFMRIAMRRHIKCHDDIPKILFTSPAGVVALSQGVLGDDLADMRVIVVTGWTPDMNMTVA
jgi:hypothetical protein